MKYNTRMNSSTTIVISLVQKEG